MIGNIINSISNDNKKIRGGNTKVSGADTATGTGVFNTNSIQE